ncbi:MAG: urease accessory protein UreD [Tepidisphaeraceae bacterium]|jgi:urease accessory protein
MLLTTPAHPDPTTPHDDPVTGGDRAGCGYVVLEKVHGRTSVTRLEGRSPLKLLAPRPVGPAAWVVLSSFGGGLVAGDHLHLDLSACDDTRALVTTQSATKVYPSSPDKPCSQDVLARVGAGALLAWLPDPVICFRDAVYKQTQRFLLEPGASLSLLDCLSSGRRARGEAWAFTRYSARAEVHVAGSPAFCESLLLDPANGPIDGPFRTGGFHCLATVVMLGPLLAQAAGNILAQVASMPLDRQASLLIAASPLHDGLILRLAGDRPESVYAALRERLGMVLALFGDDPWKRKW